MIGNKIINFIKELKNYGTAVNYYKENEREDVFILNGKGYRTKVVVNSNKWLGLEFYLIDNNGKINLTYDMDSDLYDISLPKYNDFAVRIEDEIVEFLEALHKGNIRVGEIKGRPAMIIPKSNKFLLVKKGWFFTLNKYYKTLEEAESNGTYTYLE